MIYLAAQGMLVKATVRLLVIAVAYCLAKPTSYLLAKPVYQLTRPVVKVKSLVLRVPEPFKEKLNHLVLNLLMKSRVGDSEKDREFLSDLISLRKQWKSDNIPESIVEDKVKAEILAYIRGELYESIMFNFTNIVQRP
jgi:hypothetical protein